MSEKVKNVANFFLEKEPYMTHKKLQKLVYYAYSWYVVENNSDPLKIENRLFEDRIEAWVHGPVCRNLYNSYPLLRRETTGLLQSEIELLEKIWEIYGMFSGAELENLTHQEEPWKKARKNLPSDMRSENLISDEDIYNFYSNKVG